MTQLLSLFGEDEVFGDIRGESDDMGFLPIPGLTTALAIRALRRKRQGKKGKALFFGDEDIRGESDDIGFLPIPGMTTALAIRALRRKRQGKKGKALFFGEEDIRGESDDIGFLPIPGMTTALAIRALRRRKQGKRGKAMFFGEDLRGDDDLLGDLRGDDDLGFAATAATVATGIFKGIKKFGKSKTFKALQKSKIGKKLSTKKKTSTKKGSGSAIGPDQFKKDFQDAVQASDMTVIPKSEIVANQEALQMLTEQNEKSSAGVKRLITPKNLAIGGGALVGTVVLLKILTRKKPVPVQVGLGTYRKYRR
jgi:hypothetical protein